MYRFDEKELVKVDRYLLISRDVGAVGFKSSTYLLLPKPLLDKLRNDFGFDIRNDKTVEKHAHLVVEDDGTGREVKVVYSFRKIPVKIGGQPVRR